MAISVAKQRFRGQSKFLVGLDKVLTTQGEQLVEDMEYSFAAPEPEYRRLGRPSQIDDPTLHTQRDRLVQIFEGYWGEIGRSFRSLKTPDDLLPLFIALNGRSSNDVLSMFCTASTQAQNPIALSKIRLELRQLEKTMLVSSEDVHKALERLQQARSALAQTMSRRDQKLVRKELFKRRKEAQQLTANNKELNDQHHTLRGQLKHAEASFARGEMFRFINSKRYDLNPLSLANAVAGLPFMTWRQSMLRCLKEKCISANGMEYQIFKAIRYLVSRAEKKGVQETVQYFQATIPQLPSRHRLARKALEEKWFFLERVLREVYRRRFHPKALPFEITRRYLKQIQVQTHTDILLSERAKLSR